MSRYSGRQGRGASRLVRELKHDQAEERNEHYQKQRYGVTVTPEAEQRLDDQMSKIRDAERAVDRSVIVG